MNSKGFANLFLVFGLALIAALASYFAFSGPAAPTNAQPSLANPPAANPGAKTITIKMTDAGFVPKDSAINRGDTVVFQNTGADKHWPASDIHPTHQIYPEFDPRRGIIPGESWSFTFKKAGYWRMHDHLHASFTGSFTVKAAAGAAPEPKPVETVKKTTPTSVNADVLTKLASTNLLKAAGDETQVRYWLNAVGPKKVMEKLLADAGGGATIDCHQESHKFGRVAYGLYGAAAFRDGNSSCHSGYYHGAMEAFLKEKGTEHLAANIIEVCKNFDTKFGQFECLHGVGHGVLAFQDYDLPKTIETCQSLSDSYSTESCYGGMFMENVITGQGLGANLGHETKWVNKTDPYYPCDKIDQNYDVQFQCYQMQTSWMLTQVNYDFAKVAQFCLNVPREDMISVCFKSYGRDASGNSLRNPAKITETCGKVPRIKDYYQMCVTGAVNVIVDFWGGGLGDQATELCRTLPEEGKNACYVTLAWRRMDIFKDPVSRQAVCDTFESDYQNLCRVK